MPLIDLPRALEDYFAFAETEPTRRGRRFSITLPYLSGEKLDRLQWWYHVTPAEEQMFDGHALVVFRERAVERFRRHIERWLEINRQRLHDGDPLPRLSPLPARAPAFAGATCATDIPDQGQDEQPESAEELANAS